MALHGYRPMIQQATGCSDAETGEVEEFMRLQYGTLDHLDRPTFDQEARISYQAPQLARSEDPTFTLNPLP